MRLSDPSTGAQSRPLWHKKRMADFALTQVCRVIRAEYLPIYQVHHKIRIRHGDADAYFRYRVFHPGIESEHVFGKLTIVYDPSLVGKGYQPFDILFLRRRLNTAPLLKVGFNLRAFHLREWAEPLHKLLHTLTHASSDTALATFLDKAVTAVELCCRSPWRGEWRGLFILSRIKPELWERWMHAWTEHADVVTAEQEDEICAGMSSLGLNVELRHFIAFKWRANF